MLSLGVGRLSYSVNRQSVLKQIGAVLTLHKPETTYTIHEIEFAVRAKDKMSPGKKFLLGGVLFTVVSCEWNEWDNYWHVVAESNQVVKNKPHKRDFSYLRFEKALTAPSVSV